MLGARPTNPPLKGPVAESAPKDDVAVSPPESVDTVPQARPPSETLPPPVETRVALKVRVEVDTRVGASVVTVGTQADVVNDWTEPYPVPAVFVAYALS